MTLIKDLRKELKSNSDEKTREGAKRYFKEEIKFYGVPNAEMKRISHKYRKMLGPKEEAFAVCEELLKSGYSEEAFIAAEWAAKYSKDYVESDIEVFEHWVKGYIDNWAKCDTLCNHAVGDLIMKFPKHIQRLKDWARSENRWVRRAGAVTLVLPARKGMFLGDVFEIADILLLDKDDMVQKGYGWMLKEASKAYQEDVFNYVLVNKDRMPRTALRYAIEKMPPEMRKRAMDKS